MQIRLTVLGPRSGRAARGCDVLITAPEGTALGSVAGALASAAGSAQHGGRSAGSSVVLYAGTQRLAPTAVLGVPPLVDGALVSLHAPAGQHGEAGGHADHGQYGRFGQYGRPPAELARLHVVGGPDAGGVHLLPGGQARIGRSADADVPLDDPDVSRLHCEVTVGADGQVTVADLDSTNGTTLAGHPIGPRPVPFPPGALLGIGESTLRLTAAHTPELPPLPSAPDADGHLRVSLREERGGPERGAYGGAGTSAGAEFEPGVGARAEAGAGAGAEAGATVGADGSGHTYAVPDTDADTRTDTGTGTGTADGAGGAGAFAGDMVEIELMVFDAAQGKGVLVSRHLIEGDVAELDVDDRPRRDHQVLGYRRQEVPVVEVNLSVTVRNIVPGAWAVAKLELQEATAGRGDLVVACVIHQ